MMKFLRSMIFCFNDSRVKAVCSDYLIRFFPCDDTSIYFFIPSESIGGILRSSWYSRVAAFLRVAYTPCSAEVTNTVLSLRSTQCLTRTPLFLKVLFSFHTFEIVVRFLQCPHRNTGRRKLTHVCALSYSVVCY
jgi:hypothetical protein